MRRVDRSLLCRATRKHSGGAPGASWPHGSAANCESRPRKVSAWLTEKFTELKLRLDDSARGPLRLLESFEVVGLGIHGKLALWRALYTADVSPELQGHLDYERMAQRAEEQRCVEVVRPEAAKAVFAAAREFL